MTHSMTSSQTLGFNFLFWLFFLMIVQNMCYTMVPEPTQTTVGKKEILVIRL